MRRLGTINVGAGHSENNHTATRPLLDLATKTTHVDSVVESMKADKIVKLALVGDAAGAITAAVAGSGTVAAPYVVTLHFKTTVSTVSDLEAAIAALVPTYLRVRTAGTGATVLTSGADAFAATALASGVSFSLPASMSGQILEIATASEGIYFETRPSTDDPSTFTASTAGFSLDAGFPRPERIGYFGAPLVIAVYNSGASAAAVDVFVRQ